MKKRDVCCNITEEKTMQTRKKVKKISSNVSNLSKRIKSDFSSNAYNQVEKMINNLKGNTIFCGTGGSYAASYFASKVVNATNGICTEANLPRDIIYKNIKDIKNIIAFSYSGTTNDIIETLNYGKDKKIVREIIKRHSSAINKKEFTKVFDQTGSVERDNIKYNVYTFTRIDPLAPGEMTYWNVWGTIHMDTTVTSAQSEALFGENGNYPNGVFPVLVEADAIQSEGFADAAAAWAAFDAQI